MIWGMDYLGGAKYQQVILRTHPQGWAAGFFAETFGDALPTVKRLLASGRCPVVRIQMLWSDGHSFGDKDIPALKRIAARYQKLALQFPAVTIQLSAFCEHNLSNPDKYLDIVKNVASSCVPVNTPWKGKKSAKYINEVHGAGAAINGTYNFSYDGTACVDTDVEAYKARHSNCSIFFFWDAPFNLKYEDNDPTPRPNRTYTPSEKLLKSIAYLSNDKGDVGLPKKWLLKSHSETKPQPDPRRDKPVFIIPIKAKEIKLKASNGKVVDILPYYGPYNDGRHRYYSSHWGCELGRKYGVLKVVVNGKVYGKVNLGFRENEWRN